jgi:ABC-2 type transport system permease protein
MIRLFLIEWIKLRKYRAFQLLTALYFLVVAVVCSSGMIFLEYIKSKGAEFKGISPTILPIYEFPDIWANLTFVAAWMKIFLAFIVIISITNEVSYKTLRQNVIDGLSRVEFMLSKIIMIFFFSLMNTLLIIVLGLITGFIYSQDKSLVAIFGNMQYLGAFMYNVFIYMVFAFFLGILIKRTGIVIIFLGIYSVFVEPISTLIFSNAPFIPHWLKESVPYFPIKAINNLLPSPYSQYIFMEYQDYISFISVSIVSVHLLLYLGFTYLLLKWKNNI